MFISKSVSVQVYRFQRNRKPVLKTCCTGKLLKVRFFGTLALKYVGGSTLMFVLRLCI